ncbi:hypothetical protein SteCoe_4271 [Stentor coeruleus]|uniref:Peptidase S49 domain-containing protein n=1 Tax=Stentor coeruleus TaxID=5963 RepID=A0A1R2CV84_9CILI|nr:hypothetical protein SteCoe_4271 [Stentor coeruleus]
MLSWLGSNLGNYALHVRVTLPLITQVTSSTLKQIDRFPLKNPKFIALSIDSVYGSAIQSEIIADGIRKKAKEFKCPLFTFAENFAIGSGYLLLSSGDRVFVNPHSLVGGISSSFSCIGLAKALKQWKIKSTTISTYDNKLNPFEEVKPADEKWIKEILSSQNIIMQNSVSKYRKNALDNEAVRKGEVFVGKNAVELGLADGVNDFYSLLAEEFPNIKTFNMKPKPEKSWYRGYKVMENLKTGEVPQEMLEEVLGFCTEDLAVQLKANI